LKAKTNFILILILGLLFFLAGSHLFHWFSSKVNFSILLAVAITYLNFLLFINFYSFSLKKSNKTFLIFNLGGMTFRLIMILSFVFIVLNYLKVEQYAFIFALYILYFVLLFVEILIVKESFERLKK